MLTVSIPAWLLLGLAFLTTVGAYFVGVRVAAEIGSFIGEAWRGR